MKGILFLLLVLQITSCKRYESVPEKIEDDFQLSLADTLNLRADGRTVFIASLQNTKQVKTGLSVSFTSSKGTVLLADMPYSSNLAKTEIRVDQDTGRYLIKAILREGSTNKVEKMVFAEFRRANPDSIGIELDRTFYSITLPTTIRTFLFRNSGLVTRGARISWRAVQVNALNDSIPVGRLEGLFNNSSDLTGRMGDVKLYTDNLTTIDTNRAIIIQAIGTNDAGATLRRSISIRHH